MSDTMKTNLVISLFITLFLCSCEWKSDVDDPVLNKLGTGHGIVTYTDYEPLKAKPINLHFYIPEGDQSCLSYPEPEETPTIT